jgi:hypothetical protein
MKMAMARFGPEAGFFGEIGAKSIMGAKLLDTWRFFF